MKTFRGISSKNTDKGLHSVILINRQIETEGNFTEEKLPSPVEGK